MSRRLGERLLLLFAVVQHGKAGHGRCRTLPMQGVIEEITRWLGYGAFWLATFGRYRGGGTGDRLAEGAVGLGIIVGSAYLFYVFSQI
jgi:hypothetical protein